ncbi:MAG: hypothetical protein M3Y87_26285, partial [Myxococcota bacterium]|nr:hypothetical protein [Myxococcota bacterium]
RTLVRPGESAAPNASPSPVGTSTGADTPSATADWVVIDVDGVPPRAQLRLDGLPGATLPLRLRRGSDHVLEIQAPGYEDRRIELRADANRRVRADMRPAVGTSQTGL